MMFLEPPDITALCIYMCPWGGNYDFFSRSRFVEKLQTLKLLHTVHIVVFCSPRSLIDAINTFYHRWQADVTDASYVVWTKCRRSDHSRGNPTVRLADDGESLYRNNISSFLSLQDLTLAWMACDIRMHLLLPQYLPKHYIYNRKVKNIECHIDVCVQIGKGNAKQLLRYKSIK